MIVPMARVRILGPRELLRKTVSTVQDFGLLQLANTPRVPGLERLALDPREERSRRYLRRLIEDAQTAIDLLGIKAGNGTARVPVNSPDFPTLARMARRVRREAGQLTDRETRLAEERALIQRYRDLLDALAPDLQALAHSPHLVTHAAVIPASERPAVEGLVRSLEATSGQDVVVKSLPLRNGDLAVLIVMPNVASANVEHVLAETRIPEVTLPAEYRASSLTEAVPQMLARLAAIPAEQAEIVRRRRALADEHGARLLAGRSAAHDLLARLEAIEHCATTAHAFALEGWTPRSNTGRLISTVRRDVGASIAIEVIADEEWTDENVPVVLTNPRLFRPFEPIVRFMPLPRYGTIDPTPFVAVFFPLLFGLMLADIGYGILLAGVGLLMHRNAAPGSVRRTVAEMIGPCALLTVVGGVLFGEFFGDLGRRLFGLQPLLFDRQEAIVASLLLAVGLGVAHVVLGLILGIVSDWRREPRHALGRGIATIMVALIIVAILAAVNVLPSSLMTPSVIAVLVAFPVLVMLEGIIAAVELLSTLGNILSYARVMALGMASVMLAVVANRVAGVIGSAVVGVLFALLFHLVNFGIGVFGPSVHALRLHYVEFFGKFYSPGGIPYRPLSHWRTPMVDSR